MKKFFIFLMVSVNLFASLNELESFEADFTQSIKDEKAKVLTYKGHIIALKPQNARWSYTKPIKKDVYINNFEVTVVEPELEQVIIKRLESNFDFFKIISNLKTVDKDTYVAYYRETKFTVIKSGELIKSISYLDEFENKVEITFDNQKHNFTVDKTVFLPSYPMDYDIIRD